jgi:gamma-glutamylaminecyclotransferase
MNGYENAPATRLLATSCACCGRALLDAISVEAGIGPDCREKYGYGEAQGRRERGNFAMTVLTYVARPPHDRKDFMTRRPLTRVFVYGTLMKGEPNHRLLEKAAFIGAARTQPRFNMISLGGCPAILPDGTTAIDGELYDVDDETLAHLDRLEGHPRYYRRTEIAVAGGRAHAYLLQGGLGFGDLIASGSWRVWCANEEQQ